MVLAFLLYMAPAFLVAIPMGFRLGPKLNNNAEVGRPISQAIAEMYRTNRYLLPAFIVVLALLIFWRSRVIARHSRSGSLIHGVIIASVPAVLTAIGMSIWGAWWYLAIAIFVSFAAGLAGGFKRTQAIKVQ